MRIMILRFALSTRSAAEPHDYNFWILDDLYVRLKSGWFETGRGTILYACMVILYVSTWLVGRHLINDCYTSNLFYVTGFSTLPFLCHFFLVCCVIYIFSFFHVWECSVLCATLRTSDGELKLDNDLRYPQVALILTRANIVMLSIHVHIVFSCT